ncbi:hypothetical protein ACWD7Y_12495 [Streptomyces drozdowiczii]
MTYDNSVLYFGDTYQSIAADLPTLIRAANDAVAYYDDSGDERVNALVERSRALNLVGRYLTQIRQFDLAHVAARGAIEDAKAAGNNLKAAGTAAKAVGKTHKNLLRHWSMFGPVTAAMKELEDFMIEGDAASVIRKSKEEATLQEKHWKQLGGPSTNDGNRYRLDLARAMVRTGDATAAMEELSHLDEIAPEWFRHQSSAAITFEEITKKRRTLTTDMREVGAHLGVFA